MLDGIRIYSADTVWREILRDLGATVLDSPNNVDINLDAMNISMPVSVLELKAALIDASDNSKIIREIFGGTTRLSNLHTQIIVRLYKSGGMSANDLKTALGYSIDATTHTVDTAIYQLRKIYGRNFIINENGVYRIGKL